jgi:hypothetical protein
LPTLKQILEENQVKYEAQTIRKKSMSMQVYRNCWKESKFRSHGIPARGRKFLRQIRNSFYRKDILVIGWTFLRNYIFIQKGLFCYSKEFPVTGRNSLLKEGKYGYRTKIPVAGGIFLAKVGYFWYRNPFYVTVSKFPL